jgi:hypothetical protein
VIDWRPAAQQGHSDEATEHDGADLPPGRGDGQGDGGSDHRQGGALAVRRQGSGHAEHGQRHHRHGRDLEAMKPSRAESLTQEPDAEGKQHKGNGRGQREGRPGGERPEIAGPGQPDGHADLARGRPRQELAQGDEIGIGALVEPAAPDHKLVTEVPEMGHRTAEGGQAQLEEGCEDLTRMTMGHLRHCLLNLVLIHGKLLLLRK